MQRHGQRSRALGLGVVGAAVSAAKVSLLLITAALAWREVPPLCHANLVVVASVRLSSLTQWRRPATGGRQIKSWMEIEGVLHDPTGQGDRRLILNEQEDRSEQPDFGRGQRWLLFLNRHPGSFADYWWWVPLHPEGSGPGDAALHRLYGTGCGP